MCCSEPSSNSAAPMLTLTGMTRVEENRLHQHRFDGLKQRASRLGCLERRADERELVAA